MSDKTKTLLIGVFIIISCLSMIGVLLFLRPSVGDGKKTLYVCFTSIEKVQVGTRVTFAGKPVGEVVAIDPIYDARNQPTGRSGHVCFYELELKIDSHTVVYDTDEISIHTTGLLGERTVSITPRAVKKGEPSFPVTDQVLYGKSGDPVEETLNQIMTIGNKISHAIDQVEEILEKSKAEIPVAVRAFKQATQEIAKTFQTVNSTHFIRHLNEMTESVRGAAKRLDQILMGWKNGGIDKSGPELIHNLAEISKALNQQDKLHSFMTNVDGLTGNLKTFTDSFSKESTIGKLFSSDQVYLQLTALMTKVNILADDINAYGFLFHQNKSWQRERMKRMNLLNELRCPSAFKHYFDEELSRIWLSLSRIAQSLQKARCSPCHVLQDPCFQVGFKELLDRMSDMQERLQVYRQSLIERCCPEECPQ